MEKCTANRHVAVVENCVMTELGLRQLISRCTSTSYQLQAFKDSSEWFSQREHRLYDMVIYSVGGMRLSRQQSIHFLSHIAFSQPDSVRVLLAEDEGQAKLIHHLLPVPLHAVLCKSSSLEKLQLQIKALMKQKESLNRPCTTLHCFPGSAGLSPTERTILYYMGNGFSIPEIAVRMARNPKTIRTHKFNAMNKLGVRNDTGLLCAADILRYLPLQPLSVGW
jgi:luxR family transcriptional regulator, regulator of transport and utilization of aryl beta-glucosides